MKTVEQSVTKWQQRASSAGTAWLEGIQAVTSSPAQAAVAAAEKWRQRMMSDEVFTKFKAGLNRTTLESWKSITASKGAGRFTSGITASVDKMRQFLGQILPYEQTGLEQLKRMPSVTLEDSKARAAFWIDYMAKFKRTT